MNKDKSAIFFSSNCQEEDKDDVKATLQIDKIALAEKYLGLPTALGRSTKEAFEYMSTRLRKLVGAWSGKEVSCAGREVLLKSISQAVVEVHFSSGSNLPYELLSYPKRHL